MSITKMPNLPKELPLELVLSLSQAALKVRDNSYSPYSQFKVGASLALTSGQIITGTNVENVSFGASICAERSAICAMVASHGKAEIKAIAIASSEGVPPCGMCLQTLVEFMRSDSWVILLNLKEILAFHLLKDLMPHAFLKFYSSD